MDDRIILTATKAAVSEMNEAGVYSDNLSCVWHMVRSQAVIFTQLFFCKLNITI